MAIEAGRVLNQRYRLIRPVGQGSQASVWVAEHLALTTHVAVKLIDPDLAKKESARERFRREATAAAQLRSAHVVQILDHGIDGDQPFIVMELLDGEDLFERIAHRGRLTLRETSKIVTQAARALSRAHAAGIVHRDLKPENVFLVSNDDDEIVKVLDFGVAKVKDAAKVTMQKTGVGTLIGTPHYMSPEQVKGIGEVDHRTDIWAMGVIAFQCITGELPFDSEGVGDLLIRISIGDIPVPSKVYPGAPAAFDTWFSKACARDAAHRFQSARELAVALAAAVAAVEGTARVATIRPPPAVETMLVSGVKFPLPERLPSAEELIELDPALEPFDEDAADKDLVPRPPVPSSRRPALPSTTPSSPPLVDKAVAAGGHEHDVDCGELTDDPDERSSNIGFPLLVRRGSGSGDIEAPATPRSGPPPSARPQSEAPASQRAAPESTRQGADANVATNAFLAGAPPMAEPAPLPARPPPIPKRKPVVAQAAPAPIFRTATTLQSEMAILPPPELDATSKRRRLFRYLIGGLVVATLVIVWMVVGSQLDLSQVGTAASATLGLGAAPPPRASSSAPAPATAKPASTTAPETPASSVKAIAPGQVTHPGRPATTVKFPPRSGSAPRQRKPSGDTIELPDPSPDDDHVPAAP